MGMLRLILADQLSSTISSLAGCDKCKDIILMCEVWDEATYVKHHKKKIAFLFSAMRHFAQDLRQSGYQVAYTKLDDKNNAGSFKGEVARFINQHPMDGIVITFPGEYRVLADIQNWESDFNIPVEICSDQRFLSSPQGVAQWCKNRQHLRMEFFTGKCVKNIPF